jgi:hypothetical protein
MMKKLPRNPYLHGLIPIFSLAGIALLVSLILTGFNSPAAWVAWAFFVALGLTSLIGWLLGVRQQRRAAAFLASERPLVRWVYSPAEWQQIKEKAWQEASNDWKLQWGCLTILLALAGLLTGGMIGSEDGFLPAIGVALLGFWVGALSGGLIGGIVAAGNYWAARKTYRDPEPGQVALGPDEIFASDDYFRGDGVNGYIRGIEIHRGAPATLEFQLVFPPRVRRDPEETWSLLVPDRFVEKVEEFLPRLAPKQ